MYHNQELSQLVKMKDLKIDMAQYKKYTVNDKENFVMTLNCKKKSKKFSCIFFYHELSLCVHDQIKLKNSINFVNKNAA